jgi:hypothetical protein
VSDSELDMHFMPMWFAVFTSPRHEKRVEQHFSHRDIEHYLPGGFNNEAQRVG